MGRMRFGPALQCREALPPAHAVGFFGRRSLRRYDRHVTVGVTADRAAVVAQEVHTRSQNRLDVIEVHLAFGGFGVAPILTEADQARMVVGSDPYARAARNSAVRA